MRDLQYLFLVGLEGAEVGVQHTPAGQDILVQHTGVGQRLTKPLQPEAARTVLGGQTVFWRTPHSRGVDALLVERIDPFISIRYALPVLVQLQMALEPAQPSHRPSRHSRTDGSWFFPAGTTGSARRSRSAHLARRSAGGSSADGPVG